ncbi:uncharacterized protein HKW66_Vig0104240 [Vigna angularis]|uniref:Uncharacterized protein n=1 Tax=Phaseolus angularis TaxID=3914 RepID=A0A8T0KMX9_PHAAN|nr:uncharacterized protein HKW66_Vig0104240 [Vigna angularis]
MRVLVASSGVLRRLRGWIGRGEKNLGQLGLVAFAGHTGDGCRRRMICGHLVIKLLESVDAIEINQLSKPFFKKTSWLRPKVTRLSSREFI